MKRRRKQFMTYLGLYTVSPQERSTQSLGNWAPRMGWPIAPQGSPTARISPRRGGAGLDRAKPNDGTVDHEQAAIGVEAQGATRKETVLQKAESAFSATR